MNYLDKYKPTGDDYEKLAQQERLIIKVAETVCVEAERQNKSLTKLAELLGKGKSWVSQTLGGDKNMTLKTLSDFAHVLEMEVNITLKPKALNTKSSDEVWERDGFKSFNPPAFQTNPRATQVIEISSHPDYKKAAA